jgi:broad specificity phosphatase PhoE
LLELWVFRHPVSIWNEKRIHQGQHPDEPGLSERGFRQALKIAHLLMDEPLMGIWTSPLPRAIQLATIIQHIHRRSIPLFIEDDLMEMSHGGANGLHISEIQRVYPKSWEKWRNRTFEIDMPCFIGGETPLQVANRGVKTFIRIARELSQKFITSEWAEEKAVVISHGALISFAIAKIKRASLQKALNYKLANGSLTILSWNGKNFKIKEQNITSHLGETFYTPPIAI